MNHQSCNCRAPALSCMITQESRVGHSRDDIDNNSCFEHMQNEFLYSSHFVSPRADGAKRRARVLIPPGYLNPGKGPH
jgi:hypothetical protein